MTWSEAVSAAMPLDEDGCIGVHRTHLMRSGRTIAAPYGKTGRCHMHYMGFDLLVYGLGTVRLTKRASKPTARAIGFGK